MGRVTARKGGGWGGHATKPRGVTTSFSMFLLINANYSTAQCWRQSCHTHLKPPSDCSPSGNPTNRPAGPRQQARLGGIFGAPRAAFLHPPPPNTPSVVLLHFCRCRDRVPRGWGQQAWGAGCASGRRGRGPQRGAPPLPPGGRPAQQAQGSPAAGSPRRVPSSRRDRPPPGGHALLSKCPSLENGDKERRLHVLPPRLPDPWPPLSWPFWPRRTAPPAPGSRAPRPPRPAAVTSTRARAGGGGVPAAHRAAGRGAGAGSWRSPVLGAETEAEGGAPRVGGPRGACGAGGRAGAAPPSADRCGPGREPAGALNPSAAAGPRLAHPSPRQPRRRPIRTSCGLPVPALVVVGRGREFKVGLGARARLRGVAGAPAGLPQSWGYAALPPPRHRLRLFFSFPTAPPSSRMWGAEEVTGNTFVAHNALPLLLVTV